MNLIFFGTPEFSVPSLTALPGSGHEVLSVVTQPDRQSGRGRHLTACPVKLEAQKAGLEILQPDKANDDDFIKTLKGLKPSIIVVVAYGQILPPEIIHMPKFGCVNVHASLLPKYRGASPINRAIINGDKKTGITTMLMDESMDTGDIILQEETEIKPDDTAGSLSRRLSGYGAEVLVKTLKGLERGDLKPAPQQGAVSYAPLLKKKDGLMQWSKKAGVLCDFIRGMNPWPGAYAFIGGERVRILKAAAVKGEGEAGVVINASGNELLVGTGEGIISVLEIQPSGKAAMKVRDFLQGRKIREGIKFDENPVD